MQTVTFESLEKGEEFQTHSESPVYVKSESSKNFSNAYFKSSEVPIVINKDQEVIKIND